MTGKVADGATQTAIAALYVNARFAKASAALQARVAIVGHRIDRTLDAFITWAAPVSSEMSVPGALLLMFVLFEGLMGDSLGASDDILTAQQEAAEAAAANAPISLTLQRHPVRRPQ